MKVDRLPTINRQGDLVAQTLIPLVIVVTGLGLCGLSWGQAWLSGPLALLFASVFVLAAVLARGAARQILANARREIERRRDSEQMARAANRSKSAFLANMSHELRTPLHAILAAADLLQDGTSSETHKQHVQVITSAGESLLLLIEDVLDFAKLEAGKLRFEAVPFRPCEVLDSVCAWLSERSSSQGLEFHSTVSKEIPKVLLGDAGRLRQVLLNLGGNAIKYTPKGSIRIRAEIVPPPTRDEPARLRIAVSDTGIGISPEDQQRIFETFYQAESSAARQVEGSGLGLSICKEIVALMGGKLGFDSERGVGSTFWVELPAITSVADELDSVSLSETPSETPSGFRIEFQRHQYRILVVDDQTTNRDLARAQLQALGYQVEVAADGETALARLGEQRLDAVLMDCQMPRLDGFETTRRLRAQARRVVAEDGAGQRLPVIAVTASATAEQRGKCLAVGMDDLLAKPFRKADLDSLLRRWLSPADKVPPEGGEQELPLLVRERIDALRSLGQQLQRDVLSETLGNYLADSRSQLAELHDAETRGDVAAMVQAAHALEGSSAILGHEALTRLAQQIGSHARDSDARNSDARNSDARNSDARNSDARNSHAEPVAAMMQQLELEHQRFTKALEELCS